MVYIIKRYDSNYGMIDFGDFETLPEALELAKSVSENSFAAVVWRVENPLWAKGVEQPLVTFYLSQIFTCGHVQICEYCAGYGDFHCPSCKDSGMDISNPNASCGCVNNNNDGKCLECHGWGILHTPFNLEEPVTEIKF